MTIDTSPAALRKLAADAEDEGYFGVGDLLRAVAAEKEAQAKQEPFAYVPKDVIAQLKPPMLVLKNVPLITYEAEDHVPVYLAPQHQYVEAYANARVAAIDAYKAAVAVGADVPLPEHTIHGPAGTGVHFSGHTDAALIAHREAYANAKVAAALASQPKPAPVLLTDDELEELWRDEWDGFVSFEEARIVARAIESAVLLKNNLGV